MQDTNKTIKTISDTSLIGKIGLYFKEKWNGIKDLVTNSNKKTMASFGIMGLGQLLNRQWGKGFIYLFIQIGAVLYFIFKGKSFCQSFLLL